MKARLAAGALAVLAAASAASADDEAILSHYDAYETALQAGRLDVAETEAEAAWRAAEEEWGGTPDTAVLAFNLVRLRLMADLRAQAVEPAQRIAEMVDNGAANGAVTPEEATLFLQLAEFNALEPERRATRDLERALDDYVPNDFTSTRIALLGWSYVANADAAREDWRPAERAAVKADALAAMDPTAPKVLVTTLGLIGARAGYETGHIPEAITAAQRGIAAYPTLAADEPIDQNLGRLLIWNQALNGLYFTTNGAGRRGFEQAETALLDPAWDDGRHPSMADCAIEWDKPPAPPFGRPDSANGVGAVFEYTLGADGGVASLREYFPAAGEGEEHPMSEMLRNVQAQGPVSEACRGPWLFVFAAPLPRPD